MTPIHCTSSCMCRITVSHNLRATWTESAFRALQPLVEVETEPSLLRQDGITTLSCLSPSSNSLCKVTELYCTVLSLCPAAARWMRFILPSPAFHWTSAETADSHCRTQLFYWSPPCPLYWPLRPNYRPDITGLGWGRSHLLQFFSYSDVHQQTLIPRYQFRVHWSCLSAASGLFKLDTGAVMV